MRSSAKRRKSANRNVTSKIFGHAQLDAGGASKREIGNSKMQNFKIAKIQSPQFFNFQKGKRKTISQTTISDGAPSAPEMFRPIQSL
jgi:hypothetical protein